MPPGRNPSLTTAVPPSGRQAPRQGPGDGGRSAADLEAVKARLLEVAREVVGEGVISDVLIMRAIKVP